MSALDSEDLENVPLVRMEDVQPSRNRLQESNVTLDSETYEIEFDNECVVSNDGDSIGSIVSVKSDDNEDSDEELIVPEVIDPLDEVPIEIPIETENISIKASQPNQWPTLEIIPGGVIRNGDKILDEGSMDEGGESSAGDMMYACGQCSKGFRYLFCLTEHVRWHTEQKKQLNKGLEKSKEKKGYVCLHGTAKKIVISNTKFNKRKVPKRLKS